MTVGAPLGLLALLGLPILGALYFLRRRGQERRVSALFLWRATEEPAHAGPRFQRLSRELSLLLELCALLAATAFLSDLRCASSGGGPRHTVVVLDSSLSMQARPTGKPSFAEAAIRIARQRLEDAGGLATIITTGDPPHVIAGPAQPVAEALSVLDRWVPAEPAHPFQPAWTLATDMAGTDGAILFLSDALPTELPGTIEGVAVGEPLPNLGFIDARRSDLESGTLLRLRIANFGPARTQVPLTIAGEDGHVLSEQKVDLTSGGITELSVPLAATGVLVVRLPADGLTWDDAVTLLPERPKLVHVRNALPADDPAGGAVSRAIAATPHVSTSGDPDLTFGAPGATPTAWSVSVGLANPTAAPRLFLGPFIADRAHPLLEDVSLEGVVWAAGETPAGHALVSADTLALLSEEPEHRFHLNVDLARSNLTRMTAWPVLVGNLVELRRQAMSGFPRHNVGSGDSVRVTLGDGTWELSGNGKERVLSGCEVSLALPAGRYTLRHGQDAPDALMVNALDAGESDLRSRAAGSKAATRRPGSSAQLPLDRSPLALLLVVILLLADYVLAVPGPRRWGRPA